MNKNLAVAIFVPTKGGYGELGTGYPVGKDLILTARHVVCPEDRDSDRLIEVQFEGGDWCKRPHDLVWESDAEMDVALLKCAFPQSFSGEVFGFLSGSRPQNNSDWEGAGFACAGGDDNYRKPRPVNVLGKVHSARDHDPRFELGAEFPPEAEEGWEGISGSPVFVHGKIIGVIVVCPANFRAQRLRATPTWKLLEDPEFRKAVGYDEQLGRRQLFEERVALILEKSEAAIEAVTEGLEPSLNRAGVELFDQARQSARRLLDLDVPEVITRCKHAHDKLSGRKLPGDARVVADLVQLLLPAVYDHGVIEAVRCRKYDIDAALLELPAGIRTVAEVIMAGVDRRLTLFRSDRERFPEGTYSLPLPPEGGFDADGKAFRAAWNEHLANQFGPADADTLRRAWNDYMVGRFADMEPRTRQRHRSEYIRDAADELEYRAREQGKTYYFLTDAPADEQARRTLRNLIGELKKDYPAVVFLQLNDDQDLERNEKRIFRPLCDLLWKDQEEAP